MMTSTRPTGQASKGFTLIEVMITIVLLAAGLVPIISAFSAGMFAENQSGKRAIALGLAREPIEEMRGAGSYAALDAFASGRMALTGGFSGFSREVIVSGDPKEVHVAVYWEAKSDEQSVNLVSVFADYGY